MAFCHAGSAERGPATGHHVPAAFRELQPSRGRALVTRIACQTHRPRGGGLVAAALLPAMVVGLLATWPTAAPAAGRGAPLDTLVTPENVATGNLNLDISRRNLPEVSTTVIPRQVPPAVPPRLDDPDTGDRLFRTARHAAAAGEDDTAERSIRAALAARPGDSRLPLWQVMRGLRERDAGAVVWHLPGALRAVLADPLATPRLVIQAHQGAVLMVAVFWTVLVAAGLLAWWRSLAHDLSALLYRDPTHRLRLVTPLLIVVLVLLLRPGWLGALAVLSVPLLLQARGRCRHLLLGTWLVALLLTFPNLPPVRSCLPVMDPASETSLLVQASRDDASGAVITSLRERLGQAEEPARRQRLRLALALQEARRGRFTASSEHFGAVLAERPDEVVAVVGLANNAYYASRFDQALAGYHRARELAPHRGEVPYNQAQVYFKKLFVPEAGEALEDARTLGFQAGALQTEAPRRGEFSAVAYLDLSRSDLRASAFAESGHYPPLAHLAAWSTFLGAPPLPLFILLAGLLGVAMVLAFWGGLQDDLRQCDSCGMEICRGCATAREGNELCHDCAETAARSRSEMVLATLLKNRSRSVGLATTDRLVRLAQVMPGAAHLALGETGKAWGRLAVLAVALFLIAFGWAFDPAAAWETPGLVLAEETVHPLWAPLPAAAWPGPLGWPVLPGLILLGAIYAVALTDGVRLRHQLPERLVQFHTGPAPGPGRA